jgi:alpha-galactosidase
LSVLRKELRTVSHKITLIGGGSSGFTPQLMRLFIESDVLRGSTITLMDVDEHRLEVMDTLCRQLVAREGAELDIESTTKRRESLVGADFVISAISVGGSDAWEKDIEIPARHGVYMPIADSIGPGGIMRAFRHIPPLVAVCKDLEEVAPQAWVFNYTNPATANAIAMRRESSIQVVSLCTCSSIPRNAEYLSSWVGVEPQDLIMPAPAAGLNHCAGILQLRLTDGRDAFPIIRERVTQPVVQWILEHYGILPYCWSHWTEFYPALTQLEEEYTGKLQGLRMKYGPVVHDIDHHRAQVQKWEDTVEQWARGEGEEVSLNVLPKAEAVEVVQLMEALVENRNEVHVVNIPNQGAIDNLPREAIVEVSALVGGYGIQPLHVGSLPEPVAATLRQHITAQELTVEAALTGDRQIALQAFLQDPQIAAKLAPEGTEALLDELLKAHADYLPQFR